MLTKLQSPTGRQLFAVEWYCSTVGLEFGFLEGGGYRRELAEEKQNIINIVDYSVFTLHGA
ncbi:hypothetical protein M513_03987 [Trichuris suis]|uniref:Uncharacterized protein n=1 Tax=Trichuris suis TaxID=68888 RepID=A0A085MCX3_9BILA|nr:hypothetical protein M513_03987 [Trichuris suis]